MRTDPITSIAGKYMVSLTLAFVGGSLEAYTYVTRGGIFANAQTGNIARLGISLAGGNVLMALRYFIPIIAFIAGVLLSHHLKKIHEKSISPKINCDAIMLTVEILLLFAVGFLPENRFDVLATLVIAFVCAVQAGSFREFDGNKFASTMCTGNLRSGTDKLFAYFDTGNRKSLHLALRYYGIDGVFALGVVAGYWATTIFRCKAVWCSVLVLQGLIFVLIRQNTCRADPQPPT